MAHLPFAPEVFTLLEEISEIRYEEPDQQRLLELIPQYAAYYCSLQVQVTRQVIDAAERLRAIATPSTGLDHIEIEYARSKGITIISLKEDYVFLKNITATAELAWALLLGVLRKIPWGFESARQGIWGRDIYRGHQLSGKTIGILGYGRLGEMVAEYARAFRMKVIASDLKRIKAEWVRQVDFDTLLEEADILSIHIHLSPDTRGLIGAKAFAKMKQGIVIINTSRGAIIDEQAFLEALETGKVAAAGLDVIEGEWCRDLADHPLIRYAREHDNLLISPHVGGVTFESQAKAYARAATKLADFFKIHSDTRKD
ncbi:Hydroxypyruvate reductase [subsurface metagenome]